jgi:hypothetical protein
LPITPVFTLFELAFLNIDTHLWHFAPAAFQGIPATDARFYQCFRAFCQFCTTMKGVVSRLFGVVTKRKRWPSAVTT